MKKYQCVCGYIYDPEIGDPDNGIAPGTAFEDRIFFRGKSGGVKSTGQANRVFNP